jgi:streptomycin 3"-adenylyltransferase
MAEKRRNPPAPGIPKGTPAPVRRQIGSLLESLRDLLGRNLVAVYLHGSLANGDFRAGSSDIDLLVLTDKPLLRDTKLGLAQTLLERSGKPSPLELSVLAREDFTPWRHPAPYQFHYSEQWRARLTDDSASTGWLVWPDGEAGTDRDLAAHIAMARAHGVALIGPPCAELLPDVPRADLLDALLYDAENAERDVLRDPVYVILNLCRGLRCARDGALLGKEAGGAWALTALPEAHAAVVARALATRRGAQPAEEWDAAALRRFAREMTAELRNATGVE